MRVITKVFITLIVSAALTACQSGSTDSASLTNTNAVGDTSGPQSNTAPTISGNPAASVVEGESYSFTPVASDVDGDNLTFNVVNLPAWASFDTASGTISGTPGNADTGVYGDILISVTDGTETAALPAFSIEVSSVSLSRTFSFTNAAASVTEGAVVTLVIGRSNGVGEASVAYGTHGLTAVSSTLGGDDYQGFDPVQVVFQDGEMSKNVTVQTLDNTVSESSETFEVYLRSPSTGYALGTVPVSTVTILDNEGVTNNPPSISGNPATNANVDSAYGFTPVASDVDGDSLTFSITNQPSWLSFDSATGSLSGTPSSGDIGSYDNIQISVSDGSETASLPAFSISVLDNNAIPMAQVDMVTLDQNSSAVIDVLANDSGLEDGVDSVGIAGSASHGNLQVNADNTVTYTPETDYYGSDSFSYQINDGNGDSAIANVSITVNCVTNCVTVTADNTFYVREGATGNNTGSDWNNAFTQLPGTLMRDHTYYIADGNYAGHNFSDAEINSSEIVIKKATSSDHGVDTGWNGTYGDGQAVFGQMVFQTGNYTFDGSVPGGFKVIGSYQGRVIDIQSASRYIHVKNVDIDGNFKTANGYQTDGACTGVYIRGSNVTIESSDIHNIADDGIGIYNNDRVSVISSKIFHLLGCGTDGNCGPCVNGHSDGFEIFNASNVEVRNSMSYDIKSTSAFYTSDLPAGAKVRNLTLINNVFYSPATGFSVYLNQIEGARVLNNIIWGRTNGSRYGGLAIGDVTGLELKNNIILNINFAHLGSAFNSTRHDINYNIFAMVQGSEYSLNTGDRIADPLFMNIPESSDINQHIQEGLLLSDFALSSSSPAIDSGVDLEGVVDDDVYGNARPLDGDNNGSAEWDIGPFER